MQLTLCTARRALAALTLAGSATWAHDAPDANAVASPAWERSGYARTIGLRSDAARLGPLAAANALQRGTAAPEPSAVTLQSELRAGTRLGLGDWRAQAVATLQAQHTAGGQDRATAWLNEANLSGSAAGWRWSAGKKVVSWDTGHGFRPNDVVQQETLRRLTPVTLTGRPVLLAERFVGDAAWSLAWVNPFQSREADASREPALAGRYFLRSDAVDAHAFARWGVRTGASVGAAFAWVASDALELHASWRAFRHVDRLAQPLGNAPSPVNPWSMQTAGGGQQALLGGSWTSAQQLGLLLEAWWDGAAYSGADWASWNARNAGLASLATHGVPAATLAGNLAWQAQGFGAAANLRRQNLFARLSWQHEGFTPTLDMLYLPEDRGRVVTAALAWQGDRVKVEGGWRGAFGPARASVRQLPVQRQAFVAATWAF